MIRHSRETAIHSVIKDGNYKSRMRIYSIDLSDNPIDVSNQNEVLEYATLLVYKDGDTDSGGRIAQSGIKISDYLNKAEQYEVGGAVASTFDIELINDDGYFSSYDWYQTIIVYWDLWLESQSVWATIPIGIYWWERPTKTSGVVVQARAYDAIGLLGNRLDYSFPDSDDSFWTGGASLYDIYLAVTRNIAGVLQDTSVQYMPNMSATFTAPPFDTTSMTRRDILSEIAGACGCTAKVSRNGKVTFKTFTNAVYGPSSMPIPYIIGEYSGKTPITSIDVGEYLCNSIDKVVALVGQRNQKYTSGSGSETLYLVDNKFIAAAGTQTQTLIDTILDVANGTNANSNMNSYRPIQFKGYVDPLVESGDIIKVRYGNSTEKPMPVFQQFLKWNGADWTGELQNFGYKPRLIPDENKRKENEYWQMTARGGSSITGASIDANGLISFTDSLGTTVFTLQLPIYNGGVS